MGWLFGWRTRKDLIDHLVDGNGVKTLKHCCVGNNLWCVHEFDRDGETHRWACLYKMQNGFSDHGWGYKDVDETMGPNETSFPASWLKLLTPVDSQYANDWRNEVQARADKLAQVKIGTRWLYSDHVYEVVKRLGPNSFRVKSLDSGGTYKMTNKQFYQSEIQS